MSLVRQIKDYAHILRDLPKDYNALLDCISDETSVVMIGEASHGTHEFYKHRAEITKRLVKEKGFSIVAVEADWPDAYRVNRFVKRSIKTEDKTSVDALGSFERFPRWMWRNVVVADFVNWMKSYNSEVQNDSDQVGFYGLDLYSLQSSRWAVIDYLEKVDQKLAAKARKQYACFDRFGGDTQTYGYKTGVGMSKSCEREVIDVLKDLFAKQAELMKHGKDGVDDDDAYFYAQQNALLVKDAESYYRNMFVGVNTWNIRDKHMLESLKGLLTHFSDKNKKPAKAVIWAHNSHLGDASETSMKDRGEYNLGQLVREHFTMEKCFNIGFTTYAGSVTAAHNWDEDPQFMIVKRGMDGSYEKLLHDASAHLPTSYEYPEPFSLIFRSNTKIGQKHQVSEEVANKLYHARLERAIGVIYRPETEIFSHYFKAKLSTQFDAVIHVDTTLALFPLEIHPQWVKSHREHIPSAYPGINHLDASKYDVGYFDPSEFDWTKEDFINEKYHKEFWGRKPPSSA